MLISQESHCALMTVVELNMCRKPTGLSLHDICQRYHIPFGVLCPVVERLCVEGVLRVEHQDDDDRILFLKQNAHELFVFDIIQMFDKEILVASADGAMHQDATTRLLKEEKRRCKNYLQNRLKKLSVYWWCRILEKQRFLLSGSMNCFSDVENVSDGLSSALPLLGAWQIMEELSEGQRIVTLFEVLEFKPNGECTWNLTDDSGFYESWNENFFYRVNEGSIVFWGKGTEQGNLIRYYLNRGKLILYKNADEYKIFSKNDLVYFE